MKKEIKKIGNATGVTFTIPDMKVMGWKEGDILDLSDVCVVKGEDLI